MSANPNQPSVSGKNRDPARNRTFETIGIKPISQLSQTSPALPILQRVFSPQATIQPIRTIGTIPQSRANPRRLSYLIELFTRINSTRRY